MVDAEGNEAPGDVSAMEMAAAPGCAIACEPPPLAAILRDAEVSLDPASRFFLYWPLGSWAPAGKTYLALLADGLWTIENVRVRRWPLSTVSAWLKDSAPRSAGPEADLNRFWDYLHEWREEIDALASSAASPPSPRSPDPPEDRCVALLRKRPRREPEILGPVEATGETSTISQSALLLRAARMGADAVFDVAREETLAGGGSRLHRHTGTAVRATDENGRRELVTTWFGGSCASLARWIILFSLTSLLAGLLVGAMFGPEAPRDSRANVEAAIGFLFGLWPLFPAALLLLLRWSELVRPAALALLAPPLAVIIIHGLRMAAAAYGDPSLLVLLQSVPAHGSILWLSFSIARSALRARREHLELLGGARWNTPVLRRLLGGSIHTTSVLLFAFFVLVGAVSVLYDPGLSPRDFRVQEHARSGAEAFEAGRFSAAVEEYSRAIQIGGPRWQIFGARGDAYRGMQSWEAAIQDYSTALETGGTHWKIPFLRGCARMNLLRWKEAAEDFSMALASGADDPRTLSLRGDCYRLLGRLEDAIDDYSRALEKESSSWWLVLVRGDTHALLGRTEQALDDYATAVRMAGAETGDVRIVPALDTLAASSLGNGDRVAALSFHERALAVIEKTAGRDSSDAGDRLEALSRLYLEAGNHSDAERCARRALEIWENPAAPEPFRAAMTLPLIAAACAAQSKNADAEEAFRRSLSSWEGLLPGDRSQLAIHLASLAESLRNLGRMEEAEEYEALAKAIWAREGMKRGPEKDASSEKPGSP